MKLELLHETELLKCTADKTAIVTITSKNGLGKYNGHKQEVKFDHDQMTAASVLFVT